ncbi:iron-containing alcohol dehydrogenase [Citricoccus sp. NR2]|uniref:iron-containing alcohol dehydrogenase n=1 Tax=Citricoccus sp. NR2 TaxID=3004095 RepID=UPI0022DD8C89|nr:iron-containing alcohol dehydrogenase [Citricoccus sp. NR2]WBL19380.1 iron-containing alcohol dehydrogenase [Citricoccus sp. NR2]
MSSKNWNPSPTEESVFLAPSAVIGGAGAARTTGEALRDRLGVTGGTVLLAVDDAVRSAGLTDPIEASLTEAGFSVVTHGGFGAEPNSDVLDPIINEARDAEAVAVVGVGGGSVLDSSKMIALMLRNEGSCADWIGTVSPENGVAPMILIPTTCGTGSETTRIAMVTIDGVKRVSACDLFIPHIAIVDPDMVASLPPSVIAATGMDALAHAVESLMGTNASILSSTHSLRAIELITDNIEAAYAGDKQALAYVMWGSHLAGQALNAGVVIGHSLAYCLANVRPMPHGVSCAIALPYCIAYNQNLAPELAQRLARSLTRGASDKIRDAAGYVQDLVKRLGLPTTLAEAEVDAQAIPEMAQLCVGSYPRPTNPEAFDESKIAALFESMQNGDLDDAFAITAR